jgi:class 3 adenylate cyclase
MLHQNVHKSRKASEDSFSDKYDRLDFLDKNQVITNFSKVEEVKDLQVQPRIALELPQTIIRQQNLSAGEIADEYYQGKNVNYEIFFLTICNKYLGSNGPFYIQMEGELDHTNLHSFWPDISNDEWNTTKICDKYIGKMTKIRLATGSGNGWCLINIIIFYPRGLVRVYNLTWVQSEEHTVLELSISLKQFLETQRSMACDIQTNKEDRKLSAIMFSDMVDYSALAQKNEPIAIRLLEEHRLILRAIFPKHKGHEVETAGDSFFVEFASALEAVNCAIEIQKTLYFHNKSANEDRKINIRIGVHLADVVHKGPNVVGDGVNIAARIEPLAQTGGICLSQDIARQIQNKIDYPIKRIKRPNLKNIEQSIVIYTIDLPWLKNNMKATTANKQSKKVIWLVTMLVIAIIILGGYYI